MAGNSVIGALRVHLGLDTAQFQEGLKKSQSGLQEWGKTAGIAAAAIVTTMVTTGVAVGAAIKDMIDEADKMSKMSQQIGIPIDELSRLKYAAELSDVSLDQLGKGVKRLAASMLDVAQGGVGTASRAFNQLGIKVQDANGTLRPATQVLADLSTEFAAMEDGTAKTALAMQIFGKSGADLIPLLNSGGEGLREMYQEAEELGLILDAQTGKAAEAFNDNLTRLGKVKDGIIKKIGAGMLPALEQMSAALVGASKNAAFMDAVGKVLGTTLKVLLTAAVGAGYAVASIGMTLGAVGQAAARFVKGDFAGASRAMSEMDGKIKTLGRGAGQLINDLWKPAPAFKATATAATGAGVAIQNYGRQAGKATKETKELTEAQKELAREEERLKQDGIRLTESLRTAEEIHADELERINELYDAGTISVESYNRALEKANATLSNAQRDRINQAQADSDPWGIGAMLGDLNKADAERAKAAAELAQNTQKDLKNATFDGIAGGLYAAADGDLGEYLAATLKRNLIESLAGSLTGMIEGRGGGWMGALGSFFSGFPGFATGGSFKVGGAPGKDKNFLGMNLTKGEMVDIRRPGQERSTGSTNVFDMRGAVVTEKLLRDVEQKVAAGEARAVGRATSIVKKAAPGINETHRRLGTT